ncbi:single-stranded DNA-binding protein [Massiliimalia massiliensis]|uniref:single-stranded DNA-binding protein n=1 Tax=Massiliimalia massiliensis TaxID=1852384 RepID=UPI000984F6A8|nr:single-stranded DNA-binding protein [Massiliimalia massiliensis]
MLNRITMTGRLTSDPELRKTNAGISVTGFSIANQRNFKNAAGEFDTDFFDVEAWRTTADFIVNHFSKGSMITVDGRLQTQKYQDKNGNNRTSIRIIADNVYFGDSKSKTEEKAPVNRETAEEYHMSGSFGGFDPGDYEELNIDSELPFNPFA